MKQYLLYYTGMVQYTISTCLLSFFLVPLKHNLTCLRYHTRYRYDRDLARERVFGVLMEPLPALELID
jgi:hypothetical protein